MRWPLDHAYPSACLTMALLCALYDKLRHLANGVGDITVPTIKDGMDQYWGDIITELRVRIHESYISKSRFRATFFAA